MKNLLEKILGWHFCRNYMKWGEKYEQEWERTDFSVSWNGRYVYNREYQDGKCEKCGKKFKRRLDDN